jgi:capsular polysaccharide biosynthesis protein
MEIRSYLRIIIRKLWIILPIVILTVGATVIYTSRQQPVYTARTTFVARLNQEFIDNKGNASALDVLSRRTEIATTFSEVAKSRRIKFYAAERLGLSQDDRKNLTVDSRLLAGTNIIEISTEGYDPKLVSDFTNSLGAVTIDYVNSLYEAFELVPLDEAIAPTAPSRPNKLFNYILGAIVGLSLGLGLAFLSESLSIPEKPAYDNSDHVDNDAFERGFNSSHLQQELAELKLQFEVTRGQIEQTQVMIHNTQQYAQASTLAVQTLMNSLERSHRDATETNGSGNGTGE